MPVASTSRAVVPEPGRFRIRLPSPGWIFGATLVLVVTFLPVRTWLVRSWQERTIERFLQYGREGDVGKVRAMLAEDHSAVWTLDDHALQVAADTPLITEPPTLFDYVLGKQRFRVDLAYSNDHSFAVAGGRVTLGRSFWIHYTPTRDEFRLSRRVQVLEEDRLRQHCESDPENEK